MIQFVFIRVRFPCFKASSNMPTKSATRKTLPDILVHKPLNLMLLLNVFFRFQEIRVIKGSVFLQKSQLTNMFFACRRR